MSSRVEVTLSSRTPDACRAWDAAHALGAAVIDRHPGVESCAVWVHANRRAGMRWRIDRTAYLSLHWALTPHVDGVLAIIGGDRSAWNALQNVLPGPEASSETEAKGSVHDLEALVADQRRLLPGPVPPVVITWGRFGRAPKRVLRLGSCEPGDVPVIRIHPVLDHASVPEYFVGFLVFHELLHVVYPPSSGGSRRIVHSRLFRRVERSHPDYARAIAWERANLSTLLARCAR